MAELAYSGMCLAAMFGSVLYEHRRLKKEEAQLRNTLMELAAKNKLEYTANKDAFKKLPQLVMIKSASC